MRSRIWRPIKKFLAMVQATNAWSLEYGGSNASGLEKEMAPHSSTLAWEIPWTEEPGRLQSMGSWSQTRLSDFTFTFHFHALEKEMVTHSSVLAWRIQGTGEPDGMLSMGSHRVGHYWSDLTAAAAACRWPTHWKRSWCWERLRAGGEGDDRGRDGWMASSTQWTWVWVNFRR